MDYVELNDQIMAGWDPLAVLQPLLDLAYDIGVNMRGAQGYRDAPLSGEWADDYTLSDLYREVGLEEITALDDDSLGDVAGWISDDYEAGYTRDDA